MQLTELPDHRMAGRVETLDPGRRDLLMMVANLTAVFETGVAVVRGRGAQAPTFGLSTTTSTLGVAMLPTREDLTRGAHLGRMPLPAPQAPQRLDQRHGATPSPA